MNALLDTRGEMAGLRVGVIGVWNPERDPEWARAYTERYLPFAGELERAMDAATVAKWRQFLHRKNPGAAAALADDDGSKSIAEAWVDYLGVDAVRMALEEAFWQMHSYFETLTVRPANLALGEVNCPQLLLEHNREDWRRIQRQQARARGARAAGASEGWQAFWAAHREFRNQSFESMQAADDAILARGERTAAFK